MTPEAKKQLSNTIRSLRASLLDDLQAETGRVYRLAIKAKEAELNQATLVRRQRLEAWLDEQVRAEAVRGKQQRTRDDFLGDVVKQAAYTLLNRLVFLRLLEAFEQRSPHVVTGGWNSLGYKNFREVAPALIRNDETEGYAFLLKLVFEDLAVDLPGLYGPAGMADLIPIPPKTLRAIVDAFDDKELRSCWTDDMTLGWVYQYWNDPEREALDDKINAGGKIEPHEIASKTQMFTERYMVDWLLQNSLGPMWLAMCQKHGWTPEVEADGTLDLLEQRRVEWRAKRDERQVALAAAKQRQEADPSYQFEEKKLPGVSLTELMPLNTDAERRWAYYVPQPIPQDAIDHAPESVWDLKILDPAVGSGHFLVVAFDLLFALYQEESRHREELSRKALAAGSSDVPLSQPAASAVPLTTGTTRDIVERILSYNLHGIDLDPRAVQIAAAALWLKGRLTCAEARPERLNLVASNLRLASLPDDDPSLVELRRAVEAETGIPGTLTDSIVHALRGADHLGSLLKVDAAIDAAIAEFERSLGWEAWGDRVQQLNLFPDGRIEQQKFQFSRERVAVGVLSALEAFLTRHTRADELGLRLSGEQLAAGVRFLRMVREGAYDLVVANPPYQGTSKMASSKYIEQQYRLGKADLFAAFLLRGLELVRPGGVSSMLTMRNWMFIKQYSELRQHLLETYDIRSLGDFAVGAFDAVPNDVLSVTVSVIHRAEHRLERSVAQQPTPPHDTSYDRARTSRKRAATLCHMGRHHFDPAALKVVPEWPLVYWWDAADLQQYLERGTLGDKHRIAQGISTANDPRFIRFVWESPSSWHAVHRTGELSPMSRFAPLIKGAMWHEWVEPLTYVVSWSPAALAIRVQDGSAFRSPNTHFRIGVACTAIGSMFRARAHRYRSVCHNMGTSVFSASGATEVCALNSRRMEYFLSSLNPGLHFEVGDLKRAPDIDVADGNRIFETIDDAFSTHESHREPSVEFQQPGPSPWRHAQEWAQAAVDRAEGAPLPDYEPQSDPEPPTDHLSFALGVALGRFGAHGEGILDPSQHDAQASGRTSGDSDHSLARRASFDALPAGILFLDGTLDTNDRRDGLGHRAAKPLLDAWDKHGAEIAPRSHLREYLREKFFAEVHRQMYENRPIHWPLSSEKKTFVAWITIHRWTESTLRVLLADHLSATLTRLDGELTDLRAARDGADKKAAKEAEKRFGDVVKARDELAAFIKQVEQCAEKGPPPIDAACPPREVDARYAPDLDDGVMINSAALWPLLTPQWKDPKKWWKELATSKGKKDYDWSHLAMRYWPTRVDAKCQLDPSLGVAHGCFWKYHPARAWAWELRLQDEIGPDFRIQEAPYRGDGGDVSHRATFLHDHPDQALAAIEKEVLRRRRKQKCPQATLSLLESGLWAAVPDQVWKLELRLSEKQGCEFQLLAPDESAARSAYEKAHPELVQARKELLTSMAPVAELFPDDDEEPPADDDESADSESAEDDE